MCKQHLDSLPVWQTASKAEKLAKEEERRQAELRSYKGVMTVSDTYCKTVCIVVMHTHIMLHAISAQ